MKVFHVEHFQAKLPGLREMECFRAEALEHGRGDGKKCSTWNTFMTKRAELFGVNLAWG